jgi:hypothetical protein
MQKKMRKSLSITVPVLVALILVLLTAALVTANSGITAQAGIGGQIPEGTLDLLYDQTDSASGNGAPDQDFEAAFNVYDNEGADDFVVPAGENWLVDRIVTVGTQSTGGTPTSVDVWFYADDAGYPADSPTCTYLDQATATPASLDVTLPAPCSLAAGKWWLAVQVNQNFGGGNGQHFWSNRTVATNDGGVWRNPGDGFGTGCVDWERQTTCGVGGGTNPDFLFQIHGTIGEPQVPSIAMTKTVGLDPGVCATTDAITVPAGYGGTDVYYCYTVTNTGDLTLTLHDLVDSNLGPILDGLSYALGPGESVDTVSAGLVFSATITETTTNDATWTACNPTPQEGGQSCINGTDVVTATDSATVTQGAPTGVSLSGFGADTGVDSSLVAVAALLAIVAGLGLVMRRKFSS